MSRRIDDPALDHAADTTADQAALENGRVRLSQKVAERLRRDIVNKTFRPGERLIEDKLSAELGVSRVPIREAIKTLIAEGLLVPTATRGVCVADLSPTSSRNWSKCAARSRA